MKIYIFLLFATTIICLSCDRQQNLDIESPSASKRIFKQISAIQNESEQVLCYSALIQEERFSVWKEKLQLDLESDSYNAKQKGFIKELRDHLTLDIFAKGEQKDVFNLFWLPNWVKRSEGVLTNIDIHAIAFSFTPHALQKSKMQASINIILADCKCAVNSWFTCWRPQPDGGSWGDCSKSSQVCAASANGCGALFDNECDGNICSNMPQSLEL